MDAHAMETFGDFLRWHRRAAGFTQEELADRAQVSPREISDLERGLRTRPRRDTIQYLAAALQLKAADRDQLEAAARQPRASSRPVVLADGPRPEVSIGRNNLPVQVTTFVGRDEELGEVQRLLLDQESATRLITLTGAGGCGKTRLAIQVVSGVVDTFLDGVWFVDLAPLNDPSLVPQAVALALDIREVSGRPMLTTLVQALRSRQILLLLDNCEHLIEACARLVDVLLQKCARVSILATSREILGVRGETAFRVPSLSLPDLQTSLAVEDIQGSEAIRLFVDRARAVVPSFEVTADNAAAVADICLRLDGIPLAVELAAARVRVLTVEQIATRLDDRFRLLIGGSRTAIRRQQTLRAMIDWSHDLLSAEERILFRRLAVFAGRWTLEAAEAVCPGPGLEQSAVLDLLTSLVDKSMVLFEGQGQAMRYRFLETVRAYAGDKLFGAGESVLIRNQHRDWYVALAERAELEFWGPASRIWIERLTQDYPNLRGALEWCLETDPDTGLRIAGSLWSFWYLDFNAAEGSRWLESMLARAATDSPARGKALLGAAHCVRDMSTVRQSKSLTEKSLAIARATGDRYLVGCALHHLGNILTMEHYNAEAQTVLEESLVAFREVGDRVWEGMAWRDLGNLARVAGDYERAGTLYQESLSILRSVGHRWNILWTLLPMGYLARQRDESDRARAIFQDCLAIALEDHDPSRLIALRSIGELERSAGNFDAAAAYVREALLEFQQRGQWLNEPGILFFSSSTLLLSSGFWVRGVRLAAAATREPPDPVNTLPSDVIDHNSAIEAARIALGDSVFAAAWAEGLAMTRDEAVTDALRGDADA